MASGIPRQQAAAAALQRPSRGGCGRLGRRIEALHEFFRGLRPSSGGGLCAGAAPGSRTSRASCREFVSRWTELPSRHAARVPIPRADTVHVSAPGLTASITGHRIVVTPWSRRERAGAAQHRRCLESLAGWQQAARRHRALSGSGKTHVGALATSRRNGGLVLAQARPVRALPACPRGAECRPRPAGRSRNAWAWCQDWQLAAGPGWPAQADNGRRAGPERHVQAHAPLLRCCARSL